MRITPPATILWTSGPWPETNPVLFLIGIFSITLCISYIALLALQSVCGRFEFKWIHILDADLFVAHTIFIVTHPELLPFRDVTTWSGFGAVNWSGSISRCKFKTNDFTFVCYDNICDARSKHDRLSRYSWFCCISMDFAMAPAQQDLLLK